MEKRILNQYLRLATPTILSASVSLVAHADTLTLERTSGVLNPSGTAFIFPYSFRINGSSTLVDMMCLNDSREVTAGESWQADPSAVTKDSPIKDQIAADIFSRIGKDGVTDDDAQEAIWSLFEPADQKTAEDKKLIHEALEDIKDGIPVRLMRGNTRTTRLRIVRRAKVGYRRTLSAQLNGVAAPAPVPEAVNITLDGLWFDRYRGNGSTKVPRLDPTSGCNDYSPGFQPHYRYRRSESRHERRIRNVAQD